ncbi:YhcN/YlaJ family sporulation lipoprotein [Virgibacillus soli]|uniref:YhcN/YlaJ family sporulation lipoprotein n=1 Tax=Paracerasibacillus soli TaxID=480284 RepID=A0ABU5CR00_9BACI|nr:YhcN/YlaJ family sporulation lipoprotein [Virgibacillus soli]MDY0408793.1 YhcN/YlaJ family sporulation lipoprotein [Virgibacillus soli]
MRVIMVSLITICTILVGCNTNQSLNEREHVENELNPQSTNPQSGTDQNFDKRLGYVNYKREQVKQQSEEDHIITIDRDQVADDLTRLLLRNDIYNEVATLVTGQHALIAYEINEDVDRTRAASIAKKTATSYLPGYFKIYVSDNSSLIADLHSLHNATTSDQDYQPTIDRLISEMRKSPQGHDK